MAAVAERGSPATPGLAGDRVARQGPGGSPGTGAR
jgi:hypothetical protein